MIVRFGPYALDSDRRQLICDGSVVHLTPKAFDLLHLLVTAAPRVVRKEELHERLWPGVFVSDASLTGLVKELRRAMKDDDPVRPVIRTAHRVGYACGLDVRQHSSVEPENWHWLALPDRRFVLHAGENVVGRDPGCDVRIEAPGVSRRHARVLIDGEAAALEDLGSKNGTIVGRTRLVTTVPLSSGDVITFGSVTCVYGSARDGMSTETQGFAASGRGEPAE
jgi:DNA-binding winged helix-turn-helix (wHTH) protein